MFCAPMGLSTSASVTKPNSVKVYYFYFTDSTRVCEIKSMTCSVMPSLNQKTLRRNGDVFTITFILDFKYLLNLPFLLPRKVEGGLKLASLTASIQELRCICLLAFENMANKVF